MIAKIQIIALGGLLTLAAAATQAGAQMLAGSGSSATPAAFCCTSFDSDAGEGEGCYALTPGPSSVTACTGVYFECPGQYFFCTDQPIKVAATSNGTSSSSTSCYCGRTAPF